MMYMVLYYLTCIKVFIDQCHYVMVLMWFHRCIKYSLLLRIPDSCATEFLFTRDKIP